MSFDCILLAGCPGSGKEKFKTKQQIHSLEEFNSVCLDLKDIVVDCNFVSTKQIEPFYYKAIELKFNVELCFFYIDPKVASKISLQPLDCIIEICEEIEELLYSIPINWNIKKTFVKHKSYNLLKRGPRGRKLFDIV